MPQYNASFVSGPQLAWFYTAPGQVSNFYTYEHPTSPKWFKFELSKKAKARLPITTAVARHEVLGK